MRDYLREFNCNIRLINLLIYPMNQSVITRTLPRNPFAWIFHHWPLWFNVLFILFLVYLITMEHAGLHIVAQQVWAVNASTHCLVKYSNGLVQHQKMRELINWCKDVYKQQESSKYSSIISDVFEKTNQFISTCIR